jgi:hypothetical protein
MKNKITIALMAGMILLVASAFASADLIMPGYHSLDITNKIANINDFPDYAFVTVGYLGGAIYCSPEWIGENGLVPNMYKFCRVAVYAVKKSEFAEFNKTINDMSLKIRDAEIRNAAMKDAEGVNITAYHDEYKNYFSAHSVKVIDDVNNYESVPDSDTKTQVVNSYFVDKNLIALYEPTDTTVKRSPMIYFYIIAPIVALILVVWFLLRRRKEQ